MQENLSCDFFYFFESFFKSFWRAFSHAIKVDIAFESDTTPSKHSKLEYHTEGIADSPIENSKCITRTKNACCFTFEEFFWEDKSIFGILIGKTTGKYRIKEILENGWHIHMPDREDKYELISGRYFRLNSITYSIRFFHICFFFVGEITHFELSCIEIEYFNCVTIFFFGFLVFLSYRMSEALSTWMSSDNERVHGSRLK
jgi:hypothetical protein